VTTGGCCGAPTGGFMKYNPGTQVYTMLPSMPHAHHFPAGSGVIGGKFYVAGGESTFGFLDVYDPATNSWSTRASMPVAMQHGGGAVVNGKLYVLGGEAEGSPVWNNVHVYDPATNSWSVATQLPLERNLNSVAFLNGAIYVIGGNAGGLVPPGAPIGRVDKYRP
jgi:N-acetylneuraminic acid mutarotase